MTGVKLLKSVTWDTPRISFKATFHSALIDIGRVFQHLMLGLGRPGFKSLITKDCLCDLVQSCDLSLPQFLISKMGITALLPHRCVVRINTLTFVRCSDITIMGAMEYLK